MERGRPWNIQEEGLENTHQKKKAPNKQNNKKQQQKKQCPLSQHEQSSFLLSD